MSILSQPIEENRFGYCLQTTPAPLSTPPRPKGHPAPQGVGNGRKSLNRAVAYINHYAAYINRGAV